MTSTFISLREFMMEIYFLNLFLKCIKYTCHIFFGRDKACETSAITTVNLKTNDQKFGSHIGNMSNPLYLEIDSWVCTPTVSTFFDKIIILFIEFNV